MDNPFQSPAILSICTGSGGLEHGIELVTGKPRIAAYVEIEAFAAYNLVKKMENGVLDTAPVFTDATQFDGRPFRNRIHGIIAGYPCTPFSLAGKRDGTSDKRHIWPYIRRTIKAANPVWGYFENVDDHFNLGFNSVYENLFSMGYAVEAVFATAEETGLQHERCRMFILAVQKTFLAYTHSKLHRGTAGKLRPAKAGLPGAQPGQNGSQLSRGLFKYPGTAVPAMQGGVQHEFEHPRTVESGLGFTIDGYNFRDDLLRLAGNAVVPYTAANALMMLLQKFNLDHLINNK